MKYKNSKFLLIGLLVLSILISISAINATEEDTTSTDAITTTHMPDIINTQADQIQEKNKSTVKNENKNKTTITTKNEKTIKNEKTQETVNSQIKKHNTIKSENKSNIKTKQEESRTFNVNNYNELYDAADSGSNKWADTIIINLNPGNYQITNTLDLKAIFDIEKTFIINGNGQTIDGLNQKQFITITKTTTVNLENITIKNCLGKGAIYNNGTLNIKNSSFISNNALSDGGVIYNNGTISITNSSFISNNALSDGGVIYNNGTISITNSNFTRNTAPNSGGAIYNNRTINISNSNFNRNSAKSGGVIYNTHNSNINITSSNLTENKASENGGVIFNNDNSTMSIITSNITKNNAINNGGGVYNTYNSNINITSSNFTENNAVDGGSIYNTYNSNINITNSNFTWNNATNNGGAIQNILDSKMNIIDSYLYSNNGSYGGAIHNNAIMNITTSYIVSNYATLSGGGINNRATMNITDSFFYYNNGYSGGAITNSNNLNIINSNFADNEAIDNNGGAVLNFGKIKITNSEFRRNEATGYGGVITNYNAVDIINSNFTLNNAELGGVIYNNGTMNITGSKFTEENNATKGGAIYNNGTMNITNSNFIGIYIGIFLGNTAKYGGAIYNNGTMNITNSSFIGNNATSYGGAISNNGVINITSSNFNNNKAESGGAISNNGAMNITSSNFTGNNATNSGGAIDNFYRSKLNITNSNFIGNKAVKYHGGAIISNGAINITSSNFTGNNATSSGGAIYKSDKLNIINSKFIGNNANYGGGIFSINGTMNITSSNFTQNNATKGGAIYNNATIFSSYATVYNNATINVTDSNFNNNKAETGGVIYNNATMNITRSNFTQNNATQGGAVYNNATMNITRSNFTQNNATQGGAVYNNATMNITESNFIKNNATEGGAVYNNAIINMTGLNFTQNNAELGGGIYNFGTMNITGSNITQNNATQGGGIYNKFTGLIIDNSILSDNIGSNNTIIYSLNNFILKNSIITNNMGNITFGSSNTFISPILNSQLSSNENVLFNIGNSSEAKKYTAQKDRNNYVKTTQSVISTGKLDVSIEYPSYNENNKIKLVYNVIKADIQNSTLLPGQTIVFTDITIKTIVNDTNKNKIIGDVPAKIVVNGKTYDVTIRNGELNTTIPTSTLNTGKYTITINIPESTNYKSGKLTKSLIITKRDIQQTSLPENTISVFTDAQINGTIKDTNNTQLKGEVNATITVNGQTYTAKIRNGTLNSTIPTNTMNAGEYTITISIPASTNYNNAIITQNLVIEKRDIQQTPLPENTISVFTDAQINETIKDTNNTQLKGEINVKATIGGKTYDATIINGVLNTTIPTSTLNAGTYTIVINIPESMNYNSATITQSLVITKREITNATQPEQTIKVHTNLIIQTIVKDMTGERLKGDIPATIIINNEEYATYMIKNGVLNTILKTDDLSLGEYEIIISIPESTNYNAGQIIQPITIGKGEIQNITLPNTTINTLNNVSILTIIKDTNGNLVSDTIPVKVMINNTEYTTSETKNGLLNVILPISNFTAGNYDVKIIIDESENYTNGIISENLVITKREIENITLPNATITTYNNHTITILLKDTNGESLHGNITAAVKINGKTYGKTNIVDGLLNVELPTEILRAADHNITIKIGENKYYTTSEIKQTLTIKTRTAKITTTTTNATTNSNIIFNVLVEDSEKRVINSGFVIFKINDITITDENGVAIRTYVQNNHAIFNYTLPFSMGAHKYKLNTIYDGQNMYAQVRLTTNFTLTKIGIDDVTVENIKQLTQVNTQINIVLKDTERKQLRENSSVSVKINGKTSMKTTIKDGILKISLPTKDLRAKTYQVTIIVGENRVYAQKNIQFNITIVNREAIIKTKQTTPTITNNTLKLNTEVLTSYGVVNEGYVTYKIDGKTITENGQAIKVNVKNGHANFTYQLSGKYKTGEHNITTTYFNPYYNQVTDTIKIKP